MHYKWCRLAVCPDADCGRIMSVCPAFGCMAESTKASGCRRALSLSGLKRVKTPIHENPVKALRMAVLLRKQPTDVINLTFLHLIHNSLTTRKLRKTEL